VDLTYRTDLRQPNELNFARFDAKLEQRLAELRAELRQEIAELRQEIAELRGEFRTELRTGLHSLRADLLRWMFGFWATTLLTLAGLMIALRSP
jgi:aspartate/tyrosine/aromatic aminotransferase